MNSFTAWILYTGVIFVIGLAIGALIGFPSVVGYYLYKVVYVELMLYIQQLHYIIRIIVIWLLVLIVIQRVIYKQFLSHDSADLKTVIIDNRLVIYCMFFI